MAKPKKHEKKKSKAEESKPEKKTTAAKATAAKKAKAETPKTAKKAKAEKKAERGEQFEPEKPAKAQKKTAKPAKADKKAKPEKAKPDKKSKADGGFTGFTKDAFQFLAELALNNEREWFEANKARYEQSVREPALALIRSMKPKLAEVSSHFMAIDKKVGGSLMRIHRDVRFAKDKSPYKTNIGIHFRHEAEDNVHAPGFYVHVAPDSCFVGIGMWGPEPDALAKIRARIDADPKAWKKATAVPKFVKAFTRGGESLKRPPKGFAEDHPFVEDLKRKHHIATATLEPKDFQDAKAVDRLATLFALGSDFIRFQCEALGVPF
jgi:uncharacterized protein (TIGR02453 family)